MPSYQKLDATKDFWQSVIKKTVYLIKNTYKTKIIDNFYFAKNNNIYKNNK